MSSTDSAPTKGEVYGRAAAALTDALHNLSLVQIDYADALPDRERTVIESTKQNILAALGTNEMMGLADLVGMRAVDGWIEASVFDGAYGDFNVYRYDASEGPIYAAPALNYTSGEAVTVSYWFKNVDAVFLMLVQRLGALPHLPYSVPDH